MAPQPQRNVTLDANRVSNVPITLNQFQPLFYPDMALALNLKSEVLGITASFAGDVQGLTSVSVTQPTATRQIEVADNIPDGRYPLAVTGYNGELKEILNLEIVVDVSVATRQLGGNGVDVPLRVASAVKRIDCVAAAKTSGGSGVGVTMTGVGVGVRLA